MADTKPADSRAIDPRYHSDLVRHAMQHGAVACRACDLGKQLMAQLHQEAENTSE